MADDKAWAANLIKKMSFDTPPDFESALDRIMLAARAIMIEKRTDRGTANITSQGRYGVLTRLRLDKLARIDHQLKKQEFVKMANDLGVPIKAISPHLDVARSGECTPADAAFVDDLVDVINYTAILLLMTYGWWELPTKVERMTEEDMLDAIESMTAGSADLAFDADREAGLARKVHRD